MDDAVTIGQVDAPGIRDAEEILLRAREDEREALEARAHYRTNGLPTLDVDGSVAERLRPNETVVEVRPSTVISRHIRDDGTDEHAGRLYLTTRRLLLIGHAPLDVELDQIEELALAGERLLVTLRDATGLSIDASRPRLLRVQIAAAISFARPRA